MEEVKTISRKGFDISGATLKWIAILTMLLNHTGYALVTYLGINNYFFTEAQWFLTRVAFFIFAFLIAEGMHYTHDRKKYIFQMFLFAIVSEIPFDLVCFNKVFDFSSQNVFFTLGLGALTIVGIDYFKGKPIWQIIAALVACIFSVYLRSDYGFLGIVTIVCLYAFREVKWKQLLFTSLIFMVVTILFTFHMFSNGLDTEGVGQLFSNYKVWHYIFREWHALIAIPLIAFYHGRKGKNINKYFFYCFYPGHLLLIWGIVRIILLFTSSM